MVPWAYQKKLAGYAPDYANTTGLVDLGEYSLYSPRFQRITFECHKLDALNQSETPSKSCTDFSICL